MSYTEIIKVKKDWTVEGVDQIGNSFRGAFAIWQELAKHRLWMAWLPMSREDQMQRVWDLWKDEKTPRYEQIVMRSTFDRELVRQENLPKLLEAMELFISAYPDKTSLDEQIEIISGLVDDPDCLAIGWNQTSVQDTWEEGENIKGGEYQFLFEELDNYHASSVVTAVNKAIEEYKNEP